MIAALGRGHCKLVSGLLGKKNKLLWGAASTYLFCSGRGMAAFANAQKDCPAGQYRFNMLNWNIAAINNNPFEYWISYDNEGYNKLMDDVQTFIQQPGDHDVPIHQIFTDDMCEELLTAMSEKGWTGIDETREKWKTEYRDRKIISEFMKDGEIGNKRLASMPDRITNTINLANGKQAYRPTAINCYEEDFASFQDWWEHWKRFMFHDTITVEVKGVVKNTKVIDMLIPIKQAKYPAISEEEEKISLPLQTVCGAVFDAILIHMLNSVGKDTWQPLRRELCHALNLKKNHRTLEILEKGYGNSDIMFLQEVANAFVHTMEENKYLVSKFGVIAPSTSGKRDQLSMILVNKEVFDMDSVKDVTDLVMKHFEGKKVPVAEGDVVAATIKVKDSDQELLLSSFHGDTNGLATIPVLEAVHAVAQTDLNGKYPLIFGLDANTYEKSKPGKTQDVMEFGEAYVGLGMTSCFGDVPNKSYYTTFNARTFLQPQLNKACTKSEFLTKGDVNPKDFILFYKNQFTQIGEPTKDNTGNIKYIENMVFPTLEFPSDHAILATTIQSSL